VIDKFYILNIDKDAYNKVYSSQRRKTTIQNQLNKLVKTSNIIRIKVGTDVYYFNNLYYAAFLFNSRDYILENIYNKEKSAKTSNEEIITIDYVLLGKHDINELNTYKPTTEVKDIVKKNHLTEETKSKLSEINKEKWSNPEYREYIISQQKGKVRTEETKEKIRQANVGNHRSEEVKAKISEKLKGRKLDTETKSKLSEINKEKWSNPEFREHMKNLQKGRVISEETRKKMSEAHRKQKNIN
jgi:hypothetical protein